MPFARIIVTLAIACVLGGLRLAIAGNASGVAIVVGVRSRVQQVTLDDLRELYLMRRRVWEDGERVVPVNLPAGDPLRERFSRRVLGRSLRDLAGYWNRRYFEGIRPPLVLRTPRAVCAYVEAEPNAIGYLAPADVDPKRCRVLLELHDLP